jgi:peroxiredoxin
MPLPDEPLRLGAAAPDFSLPGVDGRTHTLADVAGKNGVVVMFICNHCPYVRAVADRIVRDMQALRDAGVGAVAISSNDAAAYPDDSYERMKEFARRHGFDFPYLYDESQDVARAYGAVCTPDFFGFDRDRRLVYRGRLDASGRQPAPPGAKRELLDAMRAVAEGRPAPAEQTASIGCSIKWKTS